MILESLNRIAIHTLGIDHSGRILISTRHANLVDLFEALAFDTWHRLRLGKILHVNQAEETITDINLLEMAVSNLKSLRFWKCPKDQEPFTGIDWEWWIRIGQRPWRRYAVQAKRLNTTATRYENLNHKIGSLIDLKNPPKRQIDVLKRWADSQRAMPLYCFYNHLELPDYKPYWHCNLPLDFPQLGCSVTPLMVVNEALTTRRRPSTRTFEHIHANELTVPWRCLARIIHEKAQP